MQKLVLSELDNATSLGTLLGLKKRLSFYYKEVEPDLHLMEPWEQKEYISTKNDLIKQFNETFNHIKANESIFNEILVKYGISTTIFLAKCQG